MHSTRNDLARATREQIATLLAARLADTLDLRLATKQAHWNVKGPSFIALHELFDEIAGRLDAHADALAERITSLGGVALGRAATVAARSTLAPYRDDIFAGREHVEALAERLATLAKATRAAIGASSQAGDEVTADLFNEITGALDKDLWLLEAHLQAER
ncbi:MAG: DNA starvation/stationary phase protection protein Dps [Steroidobacteraceae bacterium]|nr:DNA starvation/stationary phase protection protein Dps [Steroidobacteraceae bacterium]MDW8259758.1 DNA starvation/stationary phase protection protein Dps [Gammaproteobacteria bacterium]